MDFGFSKEQELIRDEFEHFCKKELNRDFVQWMDENVDFMPEELWQKFADLGIFRAGIPVEYGGEGLGMLDQIISYEPICKASTSVALGLGATTGFGIRFIVELGNDTQKHTLLPDLCEGKLKMCMALTEPGGGTDILGAMNTRAVEKGDRWILNGEKVFITGAHVADYMIVICRTEENCRSTDALSIFLVPAHSPGISINKIPKISTKHCDSVGISFEDVEIPKESLLGTRGKGWYQILNILNPERIGIAMIGVGLISASYECALEYARERQAFGGPISRFQILQNYLADMLIHLENARNLTYKAAWLCDQGKPYHQEATMAKLVAAEGAIHAGRYGVEILGGYGICTEYPMQRFFRDSLLIQFAPISNEMSKNILMQFQGLPKSWP